MAKYTNMYCPCCLNPVNENDGSHWVLCEYEVDPNGKQPLTEIEMLNYRLADSKRWLKSAKGSVKSLNAKINTLNQEHKPCLKA